MILTKNIKAVVLCSDGELIFEFCRPTNKEKNAMLATSFDIKSTGAERMNELDDLRISLFDKYIVAVYVEKEDGTREGLTDEDGKEKLPKSLPEDLKVQAVMAVFERARVMPKNV